ncbi:MAG: hypothetical protein DRP50_00245 [Thermotoga sp.]|nr:MAG: hypothetical protein DRP50_00245 [Thermotoga sp.]
MELLTQRECDLIKGFVFNKFCGEPKHAFHPVVWVGKVIQFLDEKMEHNLFNGVITSCLVLPGILFQRFTNTMDAMIGYRNEMYEKFGKAAARIDDVLNFVPARLCVLFFLPLNFKGVWDSVKKYGGIKINGTYSISAMADVLDRKLEKKGTYIILEEKNSLKKRYKKST